jgi:hypothetical protein
VHSVFRIASRAVRILPGSSPFDRPRSRFAEFLSAPGRAQLIEPMKRLHIHVERGSMCSETDSPANCIAYPFPFIIVGAGVIGGVIGGYQCYHRSTTIVGGMQEGTGPGVTVGALACLAILQLPPGSPRPPRGGGGPGPDQWPHEPRWPGRWGKGPPARPPK